MIMEAFGKSHRKTVMLVKDFAWPTCQMILICVVYFIRQWTNLHLCIGAICLLSLPFFLGLPDSVRWLATNNQNSKVSKEIQSILRQLVVICCKTVCCETVCLETIYRETVCREIVCREIVCREIVFCEAVCCETVCHDTICSETVFNETICLEMVCHETVCCETI